MNFWVILSSPIALISALIASGAGHVLTAGFLAGYGMVVFFLYAMTSYN